MTTQTHGNFSPAEFPQCSVSHCSRQSQSRKPGSLCAPHYQKKYRGKDPEKFYVKSNGSTEPVCGIEACPRRRESSGMCRAHYSLATEGKIQPPEGFVVNLRPMCAFEGCVNRATSHRTGSICRSHDAQKRRVGHHVPSSRSRVPRNAWWMPAKHSHRTPACAERIRVSRSNTRWTRASCLTCFSRASASRAAPRSACAWIMTMVPVPCVISCAQAATRHWACSERTKGVFWRSRTTFGASTRDPISTKGPLRDPF